MDRPEAHLGASSRGKCVQFCPPIMCNLNPPLTSPSDRSNGTSDRRADASLGWLVGGDRRSAFSMERTFVPNPAVVTTTIDHDYLSDEIVRLIIPDGFGMTQANNLTGTITVSGNTTFTIDIDTAFFDVFAAPSPLPTSYTCAQVLSIAEISSTLAGATKNVLPSGAR